MDAITFNSNEVYKKMDEAANKWSEAAEKEILLDEHRKSIKRHINLCKPDRGFTEEETLKKNYRENML